MMQPRASNLAADPPRRAWPKLHRLDLELSATFRNEVFPFTHVNTANMSRASQVTLATTCATAIGVVAFVHFAQKQDKAVSPISRHAADYNANISL